MREQANHAADKLLKAGDASEQERILKVYREVLGRAPTADEMKRSEEYLKAASATAAAEDKAAWSHLYQALFASAEFRYRS